MGKKQRFESWEAKCPYYKWENAVEICCEFQPGINIHLTFECKETAKYFKKKHCHSIEGCKACEINWIHGD